MQITYNILFIENENDWIDSIEESIRDYLDERWFSLNLERTGVFPVNIGDFNKFDIIVVDLNLDNNETGDEAINRIRASGSVYTEILFYSSEGEDIIRRKLIDLWWFDGVYCSKRDGGELIKNLKWLIYTTIRKSQDLNNLRGLVMAETSELDRMIKGLNRILIENNKVSESKIIERKPKLLEYHKEQIKNIEEIVNFLDLLESGHFSANFSWRTLCSFADCPNNSLKKSDFESYRSEIIELRNLLAHHPEDDSTSEEMRIKKTDGNIKSFTEGDFIEVRKKISSYKKLFSEMGNLI